jgi:hypothetical protein
LTRAFEHFTVRKGLRLTTLANYADLQSDDLAGLFVSCDDLINLGLKFLAGLCKRMGGTKSKDTQ